MSCASEAVLIKGARVLTFDDYETTYPEGDILVEGDRIKAVGPRLHKPPGARVIEGRGRLVMPGLVNAHMHSDETLFRGLLDNMPLEVWMLYSLPPIGYGPVPERLIYLRTLLGAIEALQSGTTTIQDDISEAPRATLDGSEAVLRAYRDVGIRASIACNMTDRAYHEKLPYVAELLPDLEMDAIRATPAQPAAELLALAETLLDRWHGRDGRIRIALSASAPQRCTDDFILALDDLSRRWKTPLLSHVLETKTQVVTGQEFYGKTIVAHLADLGVLSDRMTIAHGIWLTEGDVALLAAARTAIAHNPISNLKLGSGLLRLGAVRRAGVPLCLGTDGSSSNDAFNMFEVMKSTALIHKITSPVSNTWSSARDVLAMALRGGARSVLLQGQMGVLAPGALADVVLLRLDAPAFVPLHDPVNHLVYCESGRDVDMVLVGGKVVVEGGRLATINTDAIYAEVADLMPGFLQMMDRAYTASRRLEPVLWQVYERCQRQMPEMNRFATSPSEWEWSKGSR